MSRRQILGAGWIGAAAFSAAITVVFRNDPSQGGQTVGTIGLAALGGAMGLWLLVRPHGAAVDASAVGGLVWFAAYAGSSWSSPRRLRRGRRTRFWPCLEPRWPSLRGGGVATRRVRVEGNKVAARTHIEKPLIN